MKKLPKILLVAFLIVFAIGATFYITAERFSRAQEQEKSVINQKTDEILSYISRFYVDDYDEEQMADAAASAMVSSGTDAWSFYLPASETDSYTQTMSNSYVGIGVVIEMDTLERGLLVSEVSKGYPAAKAGIVVGDVITEVEGQKTAEIGIEATRDIVVGEPGTEVTLKVLHGDRETEMTILREVVETEVASLVMLNPRVAYITIDNFDERAAAETLDCVYTALDIGAEGIIFDVRFNGGGYMDELVDILDELLPEGDIIKAVDYAGHEEKFTSDADCIDVPMTVLINEHSYSAAEFFAAALQEYGKATIIGTPTTGKGNFQNTFTLSDGSMLNLSVGKYYTPQGKSLSDTGVQPDVVVELSNEQLQQLYQQTLQKKDDAQLQAAFKVIWDEIT